MALAEQKLHSFSFSGFGEKLAYLKGRLRSVFGFAGATEQLKPATALMGRKEKTSSALGAMQKQIAEDKLHTIYISDSFAALEQDDELQMSREREEDRQIAKEARQADAPRRESADEVRKAHDGLPHMSGVFLALEDQDNGIQASLEQSHDLTEYRRLSEVQDTAMARLQSSLLQAENPRHLRRQGGELPKTL